MKISLAFLMFAAGTVAAQNVQTSARTRPVPAVVDGVLSFMWEDRFDTRQAIRHTYVFDEATRQRFEVKIDSQMTVAYGGYNAMRGRRVRLTARADGLVTSIAGVTGVPRSMRLTTGGHPNPRKVIVLLCKVSDSPTPIPTKTQYENMWFRNSNSVRAYWLEVSAGLLDLSVDVADWATMPGTQTDYDQAHDPTAEHLVNNCYAAHSDIDFNKYDAIALEYALFIGAERGGFGKDTVGTVVKDFGVTMSGYQADPEKDNGVHSHEYGHALGLLHSGPRSGDVYGSFWDVMSGSGTPSQPGSTFPAHTLAQAKDTLGFIPAARKFIATGPSSTITLERSALASSNSNYLIAVVPTAYNDAAPRSYTVELRQKAGFDQDIPREGVLINDYCGGICRSEPLLIIDRDGNADPNDAGAVLVAGETFEDKTNHISITVESITGTSARVTIRNGTGYNFSLSSTGKKTTVVEGAAPADDQIGIQVGAPNDAQLGWTVRNVTDRGASLGILTPSGTGSGAIRIRRGGSSLAAGTYVDTLRVSSPASTRHVFYYDTLIVTPAPTLFLGLSMTSHADSNLAGIGRADSALVRITGPGGAAAPWTATRTNHQLGGMLVSSGTGDGVVKWNRLSINTTAPGVWLVDTITVSLTGSATTARIIDSLHVLEPVRYSLSTRGRRDTITAGAPARRDSIRVEFEGSWATNAGWTLTTTEQRPGKFLVPVNNANNEFSTPIFSALGNATGYFVRDPNTRGPVPLAPGTYVDTIQIRGPLPLPTSFVPTHQGPQFMIDTLVVLPGTVATTGVLQVSARSRLDSAVIGLNANMDSVLVTATTSRGDSVEWTATAPAGINIFRSANSRYSSGGKGTMWLRWSRDISTSAPGTYVRAIQITSAIGNATVTDSIVVLGDRAIFTGAPVRSTVAASGSTTAVNDSISVIPFGTGAASIAWTATKRKAFTSLVTASGTGPGMVRWKSDPTGLAAGSYVDTITVSGPAGVRGGMIVDTFTVAGPLVQNTKILAARFDSDSIGGIPNYAFGITLSLNVGAVGQTLSSYAARVDWDSTMVKLDSVRPASGFAAPTSTSVNGARVALAASDAAKAGNVALATLWYHFLVAPPSRQSVILPTFTTATSGSGIDIAGQITTSATRAVFVSGVLRGDVNGDVKLTSADALLLVRSLVGFPPPAGTFIFAVPNGDANCNGKAEAIDVQYILAKLVGLPTGTACVGTIR